MQAARSVLKSRHAIVIGPTPPGTGVMAPATSSASAKLTSPTMRICRRTNAVDADIDHRGARPDPFAANVFGAANGDGRGSRRGGTKPQIAASGYARYVTVGISLANCATVLPTIYERPTISASRPASEGLHRFDRFMRAIGT